jgi:signal peptidase II
MSQSKNPTKYLLLSLLLIIIDQASKILVHTYMEPGFSGQIPLIGDWLKLHYVLNPGMAFGMQLGHEYGKLFLTLFRLVAMTVICWYLIHLVKSGAPKGLLWSLSFILAGAIGNVIDSTFYGVLFDNAPYGSSTPWFHGQVIDMIFVDFWEGFIPEWVPFWGGEYYSTPIFNIADSCIFLGVCSILIFQDQFNPPSEEKPLEANIDPLNATVAESDEPISTIDENVAISSNPDIIIEPTKQADAAETSGDIPSAQSDEESSEEKKS